MPIFDEKTVWRTHESGAAALLIDNEDYYRAFYEVAVRAEKSILLLGWQFDSDVQLLRGRDVPEGADPRDFEFLPLLDRLCRERPDLEVKILAWDHSVFFALEREILQKIVFDLATPAAFQFKLDDTVQLGGSHHQKMAIIDGHVAFLGSADICQDRWDTSRHDAIEPLRVGRDGEGHKPYHEVQTILVGEPVQSLLELFIERWRHAVGEELDAKALSIEAPLGGGTINVPVTLSMPRARLALSRTVPVGEGRELVHEIRDLYVRAIRNAKTSIYIETQYLTSCCVRDALEKRLRDTTKSKLDVVIVLPNKPEKFKEEFTVGQPQGQVLDTVVTAAKENGHAIGVYNVVAPLEDPAQGIGAYVYIHSKLMIVDDRFFTMGSANLANRSMTLDSEINVSWCAEDGDDELAGAIERVRVRLLSEHVGVLGRDAAEVDPHLFDQEGLVARLDALAHAGSSRLRHHDTPHVELSVLAKAVQELACDYVDPPDARESIPPPSSRSEPPDPSLVAAAAGGARPAA